MINFRFAPMCIAAVTALITTLSACTDTDLQGNTTDWTKASADKYCQEEKGLTYGTSDYNDCFKARLDYIAAAAAWASVM